MCGYFLKKKIIILRTVGIPTIHGTIVFDIETIGTLQIYSRPLENVEGFINNRLIFYYNSFR